MDFSTIAVKKVVDEKLDSIFKSQPEILRFLKYHEQRQNLEFAILRELKTADARKVLKVGPRHMDHVIFGVVKFWASKILELEAQKARTHAEARRQEEEANKIERAKDIVRDIVPNIDPIIDGEVGDGFEVQEL